MGVVSIDMTNHVLRRKLDSTELAEVRDVPPRLMHFLLQSSRGGDGLVGCRGARFDGTPNDCENLRPLRLHKR